jgi:putative SOS response-associated peptidase YedK
MCGRYGLSNPARVAELTASCEALNAALLADVCASSPRWNIPPSTVVPAIVSDHAGVRAASLQWGLIPSWAKEASIGNRLANARDDSVRHKPAFRRAFAARRALVFGDLFYEWQVAPDAPRKQPWCIRLRDHAPFVLAALWEQWTDPAGGDTRRTFTLITTRPNAVLAPIHDRMPVLLSPSGVAQWLDLTTPLDAVEALLTPYPPHDMAAWPVSPRVNSPRVDDAACIAPLEPPRDLFGVTA